MEYESSFKKNQPGEIVLAGSTKPEKKELIRGSNVDFTIEQESYNQALSGIPNLDETDALKFSIEEDPHSYHEQLEN